MSKYLKFLASIFAISLLPLLLFVIASSKGYVSLGSSWSWLQVLALDSLPKWLFVGLFWLSVSLLLLVFLFLLIVLCYPKTYTQLTLLDDKGKLLLEKSALVGFIKSIVEESGVLEQSQVKVKVSKRRLKVTILGLVAEQNDVVNKLAEVKETVEKGLVEFFGLSQKLSFQVKVKNILPKQTTVRQSGRVE
ncbi:alkaline shock response membrane anchor protein AmaP [Streptococcus sp. sy004]|uniref:alkaline shock response membrane anchor protein AmaP n=1 Tax=Streptococcus sp. sy004 TaxID=2600149 RepID=UPI0016447889|nr:alkaline shock response membrane anchor protein AmaP [Streptococcus sp. sy004]